MLRPENILVTLIVSDKYYDATKPKENHLFNMETIKYYTELHGYLLRVVNPEVMMKVTGSMNVKKQGGLVQSSKGILLRRKQVPVLMLLNVCLFLLCTLHHATELISCHCQR